ncbi:hypothetical protein EYR40_010581 [Pleurotus pulmonarius]|nr:hypothetical protein EYR40_010581 [Pleurotus pulmonarius]
MIMYGLDMALGLRIELKLDLELKQNGMKYELPEPPSFCLRLGAASQDRGSSVRNALLHPIRAWMLRQRVPLPRESDIKEAGNQFGLERNETMGKRAY